MWPPLLSLLVGAAPLEIRPPSAALVKALHLSPFYAKSTRALGLPIVSSSKVSDAALREAAFIVTQMLSARPELARRIAKAGIRLAVMSPTEMTTDLPEHSDLTPRAYWNRRARGLGATPQRPAISCAEENLLSFPGDPYSTESICLHEFAHVIAQFALVDDPGFSAALQSLFEQAGREGLWKGTYAMTDVDEYWAEAVQSYFDTNRTNDAEHGPIGTREQLQRADPRVAALIRKSLGEVKWRYSRVADRTQAVRAQLGALPEPVTFAWPSEREQEAHPVPDARALPIVLTPVTGDPEASPPSAESTNFSFTNRSAGPVQSFWVTFGGELKHYVTLEPNQSMRQQTYVGHRWVIRGRERVLGQFVAAPGEHALLINEQ